MNDFHVIVRPVGSACLDPISDASWNGIAMEAWRVSPDSAALGAQGFGVDYETVSNQLVTIPRLFLEPDGSFVWVSSADPDHRIDGQTTDDGRQLLYVELRGRCEWNQFANVIEHFGVSVSGLIFQLLPEALLIKASQLRQTFFDG